MIHRPHPGVITVIREVKSAYKSGGGGVPKTVENKRPKFSHLAPTRNVLQTTIHTHIYTYISHVDWKVVTASLICCLTRTEGERG